MSKTTDTADSSIYTCVHTDHLRKEQAEVFYCMMIPPTATNSLESKNATELQF